MKTFKQLAEFDIFSRKFEGQNNKLSYAIKRVKDSKSFKVFSEKRDSIGREFQEKVTDLRIKYASEDSSGNLIISEKGAYSYKKSEALLLEEEVRKISKAQELELKEVNEETFEIEPFYFNGEMPSDFSINEIEIIEGIIITEERAKELFESIK